MSTRSPEDVIREIDGWLLDGAVGGETTDRLLREALVLLKVASGDGSEFQRQMRGAWNIAMSWRRVAEKLESDLSTLRLEHERLQQKVELYDAALQRPLGEWLDREKRCEAIEAALETLKGEMKGWALERTGFTDDDLSSIEHWADRIATLLNDRNSPS